MANLIPRVCSVYFRRYIHRSFTTSGIDCISVQCYLLNNLFSRDKSSMKIDHVSKQLHPSALLLLAVESFLVLVFFQGANTFGIDCLLNVVQFLDRFIEERSVSFRLT